MLGRRPASADARRPAGGKARFPAVDAGSAGDLVAPGRAVGAVDADVVFRLKVPEEPEVGVAVGADEGISRTPRQRGPLVVSRSELRVRNRAEIRPGVEVTAQDGGPADKDKVRWLLPVAVALSVPP